MTMAQGPHKPIQPHDDRAIWLGLGVPLGIVAEGKRCREDFTRL